MMEWLFAAVLGLVQGVTEFLPISSSGHLVLVPWIFRQPDPGLAFDVALHLGTLAALIFFFWKTWRDIVLAAVQRKAVGEWQPNMLCRMALASIPAAVLGFFLEDVANGTLRSPLLVAGTLAGVGLLLFYADQRSGKRSIMSLSWTDVLIIGAAQATALVPGVSRSGATIIAGLFLGLARPEAARFSFLLAMPITAGAAVFALRHLTLADVTPAFIIGIVAAAVSGAWVIRFLLRYLQQRSFQPFVIYRLALAGAVLVLYLSRV